MLNTKLVANQGVEPWLLLSFGTASCCHPQSCCVQPSGCSPLDAARFDPRWKCCSGHILEHCCTFSHHVLLLPTFLVWVHCLGFSPPLASRLEQRPFHLAACGNQPRSLYWCPAETRDPSRSIRAVLSCLHTCCALPWGTSGWILTPSVAIRW